MESLESRELMSATPADLPCPNFETMESTRAAFVAELSAGPSSAGQRRDSASDVMLDGQNALNKSAVPVRPLADEVIYLAPPKAARPAYIASPTTLTIHWAPPVPSRTLNVDQITGFEIKLINSKTKQVVATSSVNADEYSVVFEGLDAKTRYQAVVTSVGGADTSSDRGSRKISASTANFPAPTIRASQPTLTSATLTITDRDKAVPFVDGKTVKKYTVQYMEKTGSTVNWASAHEMDPIEPGTAITDAKKCTIVTTVTGLQPGKTYLFRVVATYTDGTTDTTDLRVEGRQATARTQKLPAITLSKSHFSVENQTDYKFAIGMTGKVASYAKLGSGITISFSLLVSTSTKIDRATGLLEGAKAVADNGFTAINSKGEFTMNGVALEDIVTALGRETVLGSKTLSFQLVATFSIGDVNATAPSKLGRVTMPSWYHPA